MVMHHAQKFWKDWSGSEHMKDYFYSPVYLLFMCLTWNSFANSQSANSTELINHVISSEITNQEYRLFVVTPQNYDASSQETYDVVYVLDVNSEDSSQLVPFQRTFSQAPESLDFILVGVGFSSDEEHRGLRTAHFSPSRNEEVDKEILDLFPSLSQSANVGNWQSGRAGEFAEVLSNEIVPYIEANYATSAIDTVLGASLAGLFLTDILFEQPEMFDNYVITSPSVWWNDFEIFEDNVSLDREDIQGKVFLSVGGLENAEMLESYTRLSDTLLQNESPNLKFRSQVIENQDHQSVIPISYMNGLNFIFSNSAD